MKGIPKSMRNSSAVKGIPKSVRETQVQWKQFQNQLKKLKNQRKGHHQCQWKEQRSANLISIKWDQRGKTIIQDE